MQINTVQKKKMISSLDCQGIGTGNFNQITKVPVNAHLRSEKYK